MNFILRSSSLSTTNGGTRWCSRLRHCPKSSRGFDSRCCHLEFFIDFRLHRGSGVESASNINYYHEYFHGGKGGRCVGLTNLPPSCADYLEIWETLPSGAVRACPGLYKVCGTYTAVQARAVSLATRLEIAHSRNFVLNAQ